MCLLIVKPAGVSLDRGILVGAHDNNPHGCGIAFTHSGKIRIAKGLWDANRLERELAFIQELPALVHFRFCTHGKIMESNCHPFELPGQWAMAHNGIIPIKTVGEESDTAAFVDRILAPHITEYGSGCILANGFEEEITPHIGGSRMAFLNGQGETLIVGEKDGHWKDGAWFSNDSYKETVIPHYMNYRGAWDHRTGMFPDYEPDLRNEFMEEGIELNTYELVCDSCGKKINGKFLVLEEGTLLCRKCR